MKKLGVIIFISLMLVVPAAHAFSFSELFGNFGDFLGITGHASKCTNPKTCGKISCCSGYTCNKGTCVAAIVCGDGNVGSGETCDSNSQSCTLDDYSGTQTCNSNCDGWNSCTTSESCGDETINGAETCDGGALNGQECSPAYSQSCTYCSEDCSQSITVNGSSCGDGTCDSEETCISCESDCGRCTTFDNAPTISLTLEDFTIGDSSLSLDITNATRCSYSLDRHDSAEISTRRSISSQIETNVILNEVFDCDSPTTEISKKLNTLPSAEYVLSVTAKNNAGQGQTRAVFDITGGAISITAPKLNYKYSPTYPPTITATVSGISSGCSWTVNGDREQTFDCTEILKADISTYSDDGINTLVITAGRELVEREYFYYETATHVGTIISKHTGMRSTSEAFNIIAGTSHSGITSNTASIAIFSAEENMKKRGKISFDEREEILNKLKNSEAVLSTLTSLSETFNGNLKLAAIPTATFRNLGNSPGYISDFAIFESYESVGVITSSSLVTTEHEIEVTKTSGNNINRRVYITLHSDPVQLNILVGSCEAADVSGDSIEDIIVCYHDDDSLTINNIVVAEEGLDSAYDLDSEILPTITIETTKEYNLPLSDDEIINKVMEKYTPVLSIFGALLLILTVSSVRLAFLTTETKTKKRK
ncbi:hypothetical protein HOD61_00125 [archaeon]|nr:hypothetical protein [archaeon]